MAMMLKYQDLGFTEAFFFSENRVPCSQGVCTFVSSRSSFSDVLPSWQVV